MHINCPSPEPAAGSVTPTLFVDGTCFDSAPDYGTLMAALTYTFTKNPDPLRYRKLLEVAPSRPVSGSNWVKA